MGSLTSSFIPAGRLGKPPLSPRASSCRIGPRRQGFASPLRALDGSGPIRKTRCLRGERGGARSGELRGALVHDKGYYHSCFGGGAIGAEAVLGRGSIPACAGEPEIIDSQSPRGKVYPRVCGGVSRLCLTWADPSWVFISSPSIRVSSRQVRSRSSGDSVSVRRDRSSAIRFTSTSPCRANLRCIVSLVKGPAFLGCE